MADQQTRHPTESTLPCFHGKNREGFLRPLISPEDRLRPTPLNARLKSPKQGPVVGSQGDHGKKAETRTDREKPKRISPSSDLA
ncbi:hypothetical protein BDB00DRAFT_205919 [Zychaea mexicana]|uniref:uncharacterized protein n=1 Tax=Zychaea mexicana TaxID=64656 RepID=UPI0022FF2403|nr:uncharacterized protein BDB00DRAFT_205919 [Zychaea mexicana]KAI9474336.1 hypothetical protein BDB00DRAFT_205919 [Zychaea mexicana]